MPELPESEVSRRVVEHGALNRKITGIVMHTNDVKDLPSKADRKRLVGRRFTEARRHGKVIFIGSKTGPWLAVQLEKTGSLRVFEDGRELPKHARLMVTFEGGRRLIFFNVRKIGSVEVIEDPDAYIEASHLGPDALEIDRKTFCKTMGKTRGTIKLALISDQKITGLGNTWADEALFQAKIDPFTRSSALSPKTLGTLHGILQDVLTTAIERNADLTAMPNDWLISHREVGTPCRRCDGHIERNKVAGRSTYYCDTHQTL